MEDQKTERVNIQKIDTKRETEWEKYQAKSWDI